MNRRFALAQKLTGSIAVAVLVQVVLVVLIFAFYFKPELERSTHELILKGTTASGYMLLHQLESELIDAAQTFDGTHTNDGIQTRFRKIVAKNDDVSGLALYRVGDADTSHARKSGKRRPVLKKVAEYRRQRQPGTEKLLASGELSQTASFNDGTNVYARIPVMADDKLVAVLQYVERASLYTGAGQKVSQRLFFLMLVLFTFLLIYVFWLGVRTGKPLKMLAQTTAKIAAGDLARKVNIGSGAFAEIEALAAAIQNMSNALREQVRLIKALTAQASSVSNGVARVTGQLASSASEQATAVAETATTVEQMEKTGTSVLAAVKRIVDAADRSSEASRRGRTAVNTASGVIRKIQEDSGNISTQSRTLLSHVEEIGNIINSVNAISEQSKILAVNASIEASKAGEYGYGFAVVAQEVKSLASQSKSATEQITHTLTSIRQSVETMVRLARDGEDRTHSGVASIGNAGAIVNDLGDAIQEASIVANEIDAAFSQQSMGLSQIAAAMDEINISASENQSVSKQMETSAVEMKTTLEELSALVDDWTISESEISGRETQPPE